MIEQVQKFKCKNLLSFRKNITQNEMKDEMEKLDKFMKENNIKAVGPKITTTYSISQAMVQTMPKKNKVKFNICNVHYAPISVSEDGVV